MGKRSGDDEDSDRPMAIGAHGVPVLDILDDEHTGTRRTETNHTPPVSTRVRLRATLTVLVGMEAGKVVECGDVVMIGRGSTCNIILPDPGVSRQHTRLTQSGDRFILEDLNSKNHTFVNGRQIQKTEVKIGDEIQIGPSVTFRFAAMGEPETKLAKQLYESSMRDALTELFNRRYFMERLDAELAFAERHGTPLSVAVFDFDHFKRLNDAHGHAGGDLVLKAGAKAALSVLRAEDVLARIGGEEFAVLLRGIDATGGVACAERLRVAVQKAETMHEGQIVHATISLGVSTNDEMDNGRSATELLGIADKRLYDAKAAGRNRTRGR